MHWKIMDSSYLWISSSASDLMVPLWIQLFGITNVVKDILSEECVRQHRMVIGKLVMPMKPQKKTIVKFVPKPRVWKLKDEKLLDCSLRKWQLEITSKWLLMKETWLKGSKQVCGMTKGPHKETWWWNRDVENVVAKRNVCHKAWRKSKSVKINML